MALELKFKSSTMDVIMRVSRKYDVNPSEAVDMLIAYPEIIKEAKGGIKQKGERFN